MFEKAIADATGFTLSRRLAAPPAEVWSAFADLERLRRWWGPGGWRWLDASLDFRRGGAFTYRLRSPDGDEIDGAVLYRDVDAPSRLGFVQAHRLGGPGRRPHRLPALEAVVTFLETEDGTLVDGRCRRLAVPPADLAVAWRR